MHYTLLYALTVSVACWNFVFLSLGSALVYMEILVDFFPRNLCWKIGIWTTITAATTTTATKIPVNRNVNVFLVLVDNVLLKIEIFFFCSWCACIVIIIWPTHQLHQKQQQKWIERVEWNRNRNASRCWFRKDTLTQN